MRSPLVPASDQKKFAEPVSLPSTDSADLPLPGTAFGTGFVLLALRARRKQHTNACTEPVKGSTKRHVRKLRTFPFPTAHERFVQHKKGSKTNKTRTWVRVQKNSRSRFRFRPPFPLTFPFRVLPSDSVSTYLRSVLRASSRLTSRASGSRGRKRACPQFAEISFFNISTADLPTCGQACGDGDLRRRKRVARSDLR